MMSTHSQPISEKSRTPSRRILPGRQLCSVDLRCAWHQPYLKKSPIIRRICSVAAWSYHGIVLCSHSLTLSRSHPSLELNNEFRHPSSSIEC
ncbi:hypothetical protein BDR03DRAFT_948289 [Suillus americanus]|nr:hypothetical protein BDR03DRAFT_948289 [Suillus americanus]